MTDHEPESRQVDTTAPFMTMPRERGEVTVWALGNDRFRVQAAGVSRDVSGYRTAEGWPACSARTSAQPVPDGR
jgi:hypothetical protein